ncbi:MAG: T9SS type A sorting domain-containing protein [Flavobacteriales bacterium]|nr:T9SS type A sorting domain-containing protein [Flavobacteriales bacterium]
MDVARKTLTVACLLWVTRSFALSVSVTAEPIPCGSTFTVTAHATASGGTPPYTYLWNTGETTQTISFNAPGIYSCTVTDASGTTAFDSDVSNAFTTFHLAVQDVIAACTPCEGEILLDTLLLTGTSPYAITPEPAYYDGSMAHLTDLCSFEFTFNVTDAAGCTQDISLPIGSQPYLSGQVIGTTPGCNGGADGSVELAIWLENTPLNNYPIDLRVLDELGAVVMQPGGAAGSVMSPYYQTIEGLAPGAYTAQGSFTAHCDPAVFNLPFTITDMGPDCGHVQGVVWYDLDQDCLLESGETRLPFRVNTILPGPQYAITDGNGQFNQALDYGNYTIQQNSPDLGQVCPPAAPVPFTLDAGNQSAFIGFADTSTIAFDLETDCFLGAARPGFEVASTVRVENRSIYPSGPLTITYTYDTELQFISADIMPSVQSPGHLEWELPAINGYGLRYVHPLFSLLADPLLLGTSLEATATVMNDGPEDMLTNNTCTSSRIVTGSYDPNDKSGTTSSRSSDSQYFLDEDGSITYTIRFQNTGTDTAFTVLLRDELDADMDIGSLQLLSASHAFAPSFGEGRELVLTFNHIDLPDSATDLLGSQGFVRYRIQPKVDIEVGDVLENTAAIHFDFNPPIITNTVTHVVDFSTGVEPASSHTLHVKPNPANDVLYVSLPLSGPYSAQVFAIDGRAVSVPITQRLNNLEIDVHGLEPGTYVVKTGQGSARFVKR